MVDYFHLAGPILAPGSIVLPGNWGRIIRRIGWGHSQAIREAALEDARRHRFPDRPSRLASAFAFLTVDEARHFQQAEAAAFGNHILYRVSLKEPEAPLFVGYWQLVMPQGPIRPNWADTYWLSAAESAAPSDAGGLPREVLTLSPLVIEEALD